MKKLFILIAVIAVAALSFNTDAKKKKNGNPSIRLTETTFDFGTIKEDGGAVSHDFSFINEGDGPLVIFDATAQCGCTRPDYPKKPIEAGKSSKVKVTYTPLGRPGAFSKTVTLITNGSPRKVQLKIKGFVQPKNAK